MKNHIIFKFVALVLCAAAFLGIVATAGSGIFLMAADLYSRTPDQLYTETRDLWEEDHSGQLAMAYASVKLGGCPEDLVRDFLNLWHLENEIYNGNLEYEILDGEGTVLSSYYGPQGAEGPWREYSFSGSYLILLEPEEAPIPEEDAAPEESASQEPTQTQTEEPAPAEPVEETQDSDAPTGEAEPQEDPGREQDQQGSQENPLQEQTQPEETGEALPEETVGETIISGEEEDASASEEPTQATALPEGEEEGFSFTSWDPETGGRREFRLDWSEDRNTGLRVRIRIHSVGGLSDGVWDLMDIIWNLRYNLLWMLGTCALIFAVMLVYLCCAAGREPGTREIRAGGLNRLPLDAYLLGLFFCYGLAIGVLPRVLLVLSEESMELTVALAGAAGFGLSLLTVHFLFAFAAQVKTPGGFWYKHSACGLCVRMAAWIYRLAIRVLAWGFGLLVRLLRWAYPLVKRLLRALGKVLAFFLLEGKKVLQWAWSGFRRGAAWLWKKAIWFIQMLPLTWQWLTAAFVMIFILALTVNSPSAGTVVLGIALCLALVLYGSSAFALLLDGAKRMRQGDLDTKVEDKLLIGAFREFAGELNGLADVAMVAAQKQLKSERMKTELITNVSHDIKTPLTSIINYVDLMKQPHNEQEQEQYLEVLSRQSQRLKKLIDDLMEMSKASTGNLPVEIDVVDAAEAVNQALGEFADKLESVSLNPVFRHPQKQVLMLSDGKLTWRVLSNVLSNACKYALPGTRLYVDLVSLEGKVIISMKNISREELNVEADELMERFVRGDVSRNTEGSGLGLNIAKSLMHLQKGELQLLVDGDLFKVTLIFPSA